MTTYYYPEMPLLANVWYRTSDPSSAGPPDLADLKCSLSPITPSQYLATVGVLEESLYATHIIRSPVVDEVADNYLPGYVYDRTNVSFYEIPPGSQHFYIALWSHIVGAGFANEHQRVYVARWTLKTVGQEPFFHGYI